MLQSMGSKRVRHDLATEQQLQLAPSSFTYDLLNAFWVWVLPTSWPHLLPLLAVPELAQAHFCLRVFEFVKPLPGALFLWLLPWLAPSHHSSLCLDVTSSRRPLLATLSRNQHPPLLTQFYVPWMSPPRRPGTRTVEVTTYSVEPHKHVLDESWVLQTQLYLQDTQRMSTYYT